MKEIKRIMAGVIAALMMVLASCGGPAKTPGGTTGENTADVTSEQILTGIDISAYTIIRGTDAPERVVKKIVELCEAIESKTGTRMKITQDFIPVKDENACEIIVGDTTRAESKEMIGGMSGYEYRIETKGNKIVIAGTCDAMLEDAITWIIENCVNPASGKLMSFPEKRAYTAENVIKLAEPGKKVTVYLKSNLDAGDVFSDYADDMEVKALSAQGDRNGSVTIGNDSSAAYTEKLDTIRYGEYSVFSSGGRVYVCARLDSTLENSLKDFAEILKSWKTKDGTLGFPADYERRIVTDVALNSVPCLEGTSATVCETGHDCTQIIFGSKAQHDYEKYLTRMTEEGFELYTQKKIDNNLFATFTGKSAIVTVYYITIAKQLRVIAEPADGRALAPLRNDTAAHPAVCDTLLTQVGNDFESEQEQIGESYVYRLEDGSFIIIDGGFGTGEDLRLYQLLRKQAPDPDHIVIAAWIFTHAHTDHADTFIGFSKAYAKDVTVERFIYHFPTEEQAARTSMAIYQAKVLSAMERFPSAERNIAHAGQEYVVRNAKITVLFAMDIFEPQALKNYNVSSLVCKIETGNHSFLLTGDHAVEAQHSNGWLMNMYTTQTLGSEFVQVVHHGFGGGGTANFYAMVGADYVLWPVGMKEVNSHNLKNEARNSYFKTKGTVFISDDDITVFTLGETVSYKTYDTLAKYLAS